MTPWLYSTRMYEIVLSTIRVLGSVRREKNQVHGVVFGAFFNEKKCLDVSWVYLGQDGVCVSLEQIARTAERAEAALLSEESFGRVLARMSI